MSRARGAETLDYSEQKRKHSFSMMGYEHATGPSNPPIDQLSLCVLLSAESPPLPALVLNVTQSMLECRGILFNPAKNALVMKGLALHLVHWTRPG